ncbi:hypothetical protein GCM10027277_49270 [Pseudoduganella ginsengisoli]
MLTLGLRAALLLAVAYAGLCLLLYFTQRSYIYFPPPTTATDLATALMLDADGVDIHVSVHARQADDAVLYFGGNAEDVDASLPELAAAFPGRALYLMHYRGYGASGGKPSERALVADAQMLFDHMRSNHRRITVVGRSLGSGIAIQIAAKHPVERLVLVTPYSSVLEIAARQFPYVPVNWLLSDKYESWRHAVKVNAPTTLIAAEHDEVIPRASTDQLLAHFKPGLAALKVVRGTGHNTIGIDGQYVAMLREN